MKFNNLEEAGAAALAAAHWPALQVLDHLRDLDLGPAGEAALATARWPALQTVQLCDNDIPWRQARWPDVDDDYDVL